MVNFINSLYYEFLETYGDEIHKDPDYKGEDETYTQALKKIEGLLPDNEKNLVNIVDEAAVRKTEIAEKKVFFHGVKMISKFFIDIFSK